jgi:acyl-CoA hydrolase
MREMTATEAAALLRPVDTVGLGLGPANPHTMLRAMSERKDWEQLTIGGALILGLFELFTHPNVAYRAGFFGPAERYYRSVGGNVEHVPAGFRQFAPILRRLAPRVMMAQATPPDQHGFCSLSLHCGATLDELRAAGADPDRLLIVETSPHLPWTSGIPGMENRLSINEIDVLVRGEEVPFELPGEAPTEADLAIAQHTLPYIASNATLQTGIGAIPNTVAEALAQREGGEYGIHSEMFTDGLWKLQASGKVTNTHKGIYDGYSLTTFALGSKGLYEWLHENREVRFAPVSIVNDPTIISQNKNFVSINGAITVDLYGQVVADSVAGAQVSGVGGHEDFVAGADLSVDDVSLICLRSTIEVNGETVSRIAAQLPLGSVVATPRHHTAVIVTEFGAADLRGATVRERAHMLADIAHPQFRDELRAAAEVIAR